MSKHIILAEDDAKGAINAYFQVGQHYKAMKIVMLMEDNLPSSHGRNLFQALNGAALLVDEDGKARIVDALEEERLQQLRETQKALKLLVKAIGGMRLPQSLDTALLLSRQIGPAYIAAKELVGKLPKDC